MRKALILVTALALALGATTVAGAGTAAANEHGRGDRGHDERGDGDRGHGPSSHDSGASGTIVVDWNQELLRIVRTPGAQPATVHPTRNFAILQAAIYDAVVSITHDAPPYLFTVRAADDARPDVAAITAAYDALHTAAAAKDLKGFLEAQGFDAKQAAAVRGLDGIQTDFAAFADRFLTPGQGGEGSRGPGWASLRAEGVNSRNAKFVNYYWFTTCGDKLVLTRISVNPQ